MLKDVIGASNQLIPEERCTSIHIVNAVVFKRESLGIYGKVFKETCPDSLNQISYGQALERTTLRGVQTTIDLRDILT